MGQMLIWVAVAGILFLASKSSIWDIAAHPFMYDTLPKILQGANLILFILLLIRFSDLQGYEERFAKVLRFGALALLFQGAAIFFSNSSSDYSSVITLLISIGELLTGLYFLYHYCGAFADLTSTIDDTVAAKWRMLLVIYGVEMLAQLVVLGIIFFKAKNMRTYSDMLFVANAAVWWAILVPAVTAVVMIIESIIFSKTIKCFENEQRYQ
jgi:hypothetical protein